LPEINSLPRAELQIARGDRNHDRALGEHGADVRRHVVRSLGVVLVSGITVRRQAAHESFEVAPNARVPVLPDENRRARMQHENMAEAIHHTAFTHDGRQLLGELEETPATRAYLELSSVHWRASPVRIIPPAIRRIEGLHAHRPE